MPVLRHVGFLSIAVNGVRRNAQLKSPDSEDVYDGLRHSHLKCYQCHEILKYVLYQSISWWSFLEWSIGWFRSIFEYKISSEA